MSRPRVVVLRGHNVNVWDLRPLERLEGPRDEWDAITLNYTSGTTGDPKGVLYSHRSNVLHSLAAIQPDMLGLSARDIALPVVPLFHANGWSFAFSAPMTGASLVFPGARLDGPSVHELLVSERVTISAAVPTIAQMTGGYAGTCRRYCWSPRSLPRFFS